jgi:hypothetical protein
VTNAPKAKGTAAETAVVTFLRANGFPHVERRALSGSQDRGDVAGIPGLVIEVKDEVATGRPRLGVWLNEAIREAERDGQPAGKEMAVVWHKRRGNMSAADWYVTMDGWTFLEFLKEWTG